MNDLSLKEKIGQLVMVGVDGVFFDEKTRHRINEMKTGAFLLFSKNTPDPLTTSELIRYMQQESMKTHRFPLFIAIDQEQGRVIRLKNGLTLFPGNYALGKINDLSVTKKVAHITGKELLQVGFNLNFAPVADINSNPENPVIGTRSFGENPETVAMMVQETIRSYNEIGMLSCAKHFPGHGDVNIDSHLALPVSHKQIDDLYKSELIPFQTAIDSKVPFIMTAHISYPLIDPNYPATISKLFLEKLLRHKMGFDGIIISDDISMKALSDNYPFPDMAVEMILAGCDMIILSENLSCDFTYEDVYKALYDAVKSGKIPADRLDSSVERIFNLKNRIQWKTSEILSENLCPVKQNEHEAFSHVVMKQAFETNEDSKHFPLNINNKKVFVLSDVKAFCETFETVCEKSFLLNKETQAEIIKDTLQNADEILIFLSNKIHMNSLKKMAFNGKALIRLFSINDPYLLNAASFKPDSFINLYSSNIPIAFVKTLIIN